MEETGKKIFNLMVKAFIFNLMMLVSILTFAGVIHGVVDHGLEWGYAIIGGINFGLVGYYLHIMFRKIFNV